MPPFDFLVGRLPDAARDGSIMLAICLVSKMKIPLNGSLFSIDEVDGPISRDGKHFPVRVCYASKQILVLKTLPEDIKKYVLAAAIAEVCARHRVPLISPQWLDD